MTLPANITLPLNEPAITSDDPQQFYDYMRRLVYNVASQIQATNQTVNGTTILLNASSVPSFAFIKGTTTAGVGTYTNPVLWVRRTNLLVFAWFDITWTAHTGTGNVLIQLPFFAQPSLGFPNVSVIEPDNVAFSVGYTYLTGNLAPNTNTIAVNQCGSSKNVMALPLTATGHLRGSITYAGQLNN